ncbi:MAG: hypothetical protein AAFV71_28530 [Cyanobacteria bacterium J06633_8]
MMKLKIVLFGLVLAVIFALVPHLSFAQEIPTLKQGMPYYKARNILLNSGWQAVFNRDILNSEKSAPVDFYFNKKEYTEIVDCAGSGLGLCLFQFQNAYGKKLMISTSNNGESAQLFQWWIEKPDCKAE